MINSCLKRFEKKWGFTLIELLVVISIIGILTALGVVSFTNARRASRDTRRLGDIKNVVWRKGLIVMSSRPDPISANEFFSAICQWFIETPHLFKLEVNEEIGNEINRKRLSQVKFFSKDFYQSQETVIVGDKVAVAVFTEHPYAFLIQDTVVADSYRKHFELLWKMAKK